MGSQTIDYEELARQARRQGAPVGGSTPSPGPTGTGVDIDYSGLADQARIAAQLDNPSNVLDYTDPTGLKVYRQTGVPLMQTGPGEPATRQPAPKDLGRFGGDYAFGRDIQSGYQSGIAAVDRLIGNIGGMLEKSSQFSPLGGGAAGAEIFKHIGNWARQEQQFHEQKAGEFADDRKGIANKVVRGATSAAMSLPVTAAATMYGGPVLGMAGLGALETADQGDIGMLKGAAEGAAMGKFMHVLSPAGRLLRVPIVAAAEYAKNIAQGVDHETALANALNMAGLSAIGGKGTVSARELPGHILDTVKPNLTVKSVLNPVEQSAIDYLREKKIPLTPGTITGNRYLRANEAVVKTSPLGQQTAADFNRGTTEGIQRVAGELSNQVYPEPQTPESAGQAVTGKLQKNIKDLGLAEDEAYQDAWIGRGEDKFTERVPVRMGKTAELDAQGLPTGRMVDQPVYEKVNMPVDVRDLKVQAAPIFEEMQWMPAAEQASSAGYAALKKLLSGDDFIPAWQAEKGLSGLKTMARVTSKSGVRDTAQGIAAGLIPDLQQSIDAAVAKTGQNSINGLMRGRATHASMMEVADLADKLRTEPVQTFKQMVWEHDAGIDFLRKIQEQAPEQMPQIGRAWVQQQFEKAAEEGGFTKTGGILTKWRNLGPGTQKILFPDPAVRESLGHLFKGADMVQFNPNTSGTELLRQATSTNPLRWVAGYLGSKLFYTPTGIELLTEKLRPRMGPPAAPAAAPPTGGGPPSTPPGGGQSPPAGQGGGIREQLQARIKQRIGEFASSEEGSSPRRRPAEPIAAVSLKYLMDNPLDVPGRGESGQVKTVDVGRQIRQTVRASGGSLAPDSEARFRQARAEAAMVDDLNYALASQPEARKWYTESVQEMEAELIKNRPEFQAATKRSLFKYLLGVTSNGVDPETNFDAAVRGWDLYKEHGKFMAYDPGRTSELSNSGQVGLTFRANSYETAMKRLDSLVQDKGEAGAVKWLKSKQTIEELKKYDPKITVGDGSPRYGSYVLGEKVGAFGANLNGIYTELTADKWWSRTWNRWMGTTIATDREGKFKYDKTGEPLTQDDPRNETERALMRESAASVAKDMNLTVAELQAVLWYAEQALYRAHGLSAGSADYSMAAKKYFSKVSKRSASSPGSRPAAAPSPPPPGSGPGLSP